MTLIKPKKILIVDDECFNRYCVRIILKVAGVPNIDDICVDAENGQKAYDIIVKDVEKNNGHTSSFELIFMDFQMPIMDGNKAT